MKSTLKMILNLENGKTYTMDLANPRTDLTKEETVAFMNDLIADKAIVVGGALAVSVKKAYIQSVDEQSIA
jgi:hypothetical protein